MRSVAEVFSSYEVLDVDGCHINGTDKNGPNHQYGDAYSSIFPDRASIKLMMEVGVADGSCLLAWRDIFPNALCVGMDIHPSEKAHGERIEFYLGDQRLQYDCEKAAAGRMFDLIVEDATHYLSDTLLTMFWLWPFIAPGGLYVVEEFANIHGLRRNVIAMWPNAEIVNTNSPFGGIEPLVVFRKSL